MSWEWDKTTFSLIYSTFEEDDHGLKLEREPSITCAMLMRVFW